MTRNLPDFNNTNLATMWVNLWIEGGRGLGVAAQHVKGNALILPDCFCIYLYKVCAFIIAAVKTELPAKTRKL